MNSGHRCITRNHGKKGILDTTKDCGYDKVILWAYGYFKGSWEEGNSGNYKESWEINGIMGEAEDDGNDEVMCRGLLGTTMDYGKKGIGNREMCDLVYEYHMESWEEGNI